MPKHLVARVRVVRAILTVVRLIVDMLARVLFHGSRIVVNHRVAHETLATITQRAVRCGGD